MFFVRFTFLARLGKIWTPENQVSVKSPSSELT